MYRESHKGLLEEYMRNYYRSHQAQLSAKNKAWYEANKDRIREYEKKKYEKNKKKILAYQKEYINRPGVRDRHNRRARGYRQRDRLLVLGHYSKGKMKCALCNEKRYECLTVDHINGGGYRHKQQIHHGHLYRWLMQHGFPEGYRILCWNCNCSVRSK